MRADKIRNHFIENADWIDPCSTLDRIIIGRHDKEIKRILVAWIADNKAVKTAISGNYDMLITHEPTFWVHDETDRLKNDSFSEFHKESADKKRRIIEDNGLVVFRMHDVWDRMPGIGVPWAWGEFLGLGKTPKTISEDRYLHRYDIEPLFLEDFASIVSKKTALLGESAIQIIGDMNAEISRIGVGTGCACDIYEYVKMGCDLAVITDDGSRYWREMQWAIDNEYPLIRVNHSTSEKPGMMKLADYITDNLEGITADYFHQNSRIKIIGGDYNY